MDNLNIDYAGMHASVIAAWLIIATLAGFFARRIVRGRNILGLWGDAAIGLVGLYLLGTLFRAFGFDLSVLLFSWVPNDSFDIAIWLDILTTSFLGALIIRAVIRPFGGSKN